MASADLKDELNCSICLQFYNEPITLRCGHSFCLGCIRSVLDTQDSLKVYTCPECRAEYPKRPELQRNMKLCNIVEHFRLTQPGQKKVAGIYCTYCVHASVPAVKTCLMCEASLCDVHLGVHSKSVDHVLTEPTSSTESRKCSTHNEILKYFCCKDAACICVSCCVFGEHRGHKVELLKEASDKKKDRMRKVLEKLTSRKDETEKSIQHLQEHRKEVQERATEATAKVTALFIELREQLRALEERILSDISRQQNKVSMSVSDLIQHQEIKMGDLSRKMSHIEELCKMPDPLTVLQGREFTRADYDEGLYKQIQVVDNLDEVSITLMLNSALSDLVTNAKTEFKVQDILLDVNTAAVDVAISGDLKSATWSKTPLWAKTPRRFKNYCQVLSFQSFSSGQHYWEVETSELGNWRVGVAYPSIERKGDVSGIGQNNKSWCLRLCQKDYFVSHGSKEMKLEVDSPLQKMGIYLDYEAGRLTFYQLCFMMDSLSAVWAGACVLPLVLITAFCLGCRRKIPVHIPETCQYDRHPPCIPPSNSFIVISKSQGCSILQRPSTSQNEFLTIPRSPIPNASRRSSAGYQDVSENVPISGGILISKRQEQEDDEDHDYDDNDAPSDISNHGYIQVLPDEHSAEPEPVVAGPSCDNDNRGSLSSVTLDYVNVGPPPELKVVSEARDDNYVNVGESSESKESLEYVNVDDPVKPARVINIDSDDDDIPDYENLQDGCKV
ncbi:E3 ubiquitin-protein ligase TRIM58-like [Hyperolius riggenbachi]|uniref:E3 ubiquitin-protein ligase TRIM58-like n=1 Tax=Hyperolius riggenbachi TaxID=752182 RepID=UPI0035A32828